MARRPHRPFTAGLKAKVVLDSLAVTTTQAEVCRKHLFSPSRFAPWKVTLLERLPTAFYADDRHSPPSAYPSLSGWFASRLWSCLP